MARAGLIDAVSRYIEKYYVPEKDYNVMGRQMETIFDISILGKKKHLEEPMTEQTKESSVQKMKVFSSMTGNIVTDHKLDVYMEQMDDTFSQKLLHMIDDRGIKDSEVYAKAHIDRRHFSKIRNDVNYVPNKKTVLAFAIALELSLDEAKDLLECAGFALSRSSKMDIIVMYFLQNKIYDMFEINDVLNAYDQPIFE
ncbi:MAG: helix-turn-helix domain-containing protein [Lachnospiraceae bacterium]